MLEELCTEQQPKVLEGTGHCKGEGHFYTVSHWTQANYASHFWCWELPTWCIVLLHNNSEGSIWKFKPYGSYFYSVVSINAWIRGRDVTKTSGEGYRCLFLQSHGHIPYSHFLTRPPTPLSQRLLPNEVLDQNPLLFQQNTRLTTD